MTDADLIRFLDGDYCARLDGGDWSVLLTDSETRAEDGRTTTRFVASTAVVDRMGDVIDQGTWRLRNFRRNPVILADHDRTLVVGRGTAKTATRDESKRLEIEVAWDASEANPVGLLLAHQHANGFRHAGSVGFRPGKAISRKAIAEDSPFAAFRVTDPNTPAWAAGHLFRHNELLEFSSVSVPANPDAEQLRAYVGEVEGDEDEQIARSLESVDSRIRSIILEMVRADQEIRRCILGLVFSEPASETETASDLDRWFDQ